MSNTLRMRHFLNSNPTAQTQLNSLKIPAASRRQGENKKQLHKGFAAICRLCRRDMHFVRDMCFALHLSPRGTSDAAIRSFLSLRGANLFATRQSKNLRKWRLPRYARNDKRVAMTEAKSLTTAKTKPTKNESKKPAKTLNNEGVSVIVAQIL